MPLEDKANILYRTAAKVPRLLKKPADRFLAVRRLGDVLHKLRLPPVMVPTLTIPHAVKGSRAAAPHRKRWDREGQDAGRQGLDQWPNHRIVHKQFMESWAAFTQRAKVPPRGS